MADLKKDFKIKVDSREADKTIETLEQKMRNLHIALGILKKELSGIKLNVKIDLVDSNSKKTSIGYLIQNIIKRCQKMLKR